jgi:hypothetical protein
MAIKANLDAIRATTRLLVPKHQYSAEFLLNHFTLEPSTATPFHWAVSCTHAFFPSASKTQIDALDRYFKYNLSKELQLLLSITNGAELFRVNYKGQTLGGYWVARYKLLNSSELIAVNAQLLDTFQSYSESDLEFIPADGLNYIAFCDIGDGNFLAINIEEKANGHIFLLDHDYAYYPYGIEFTQDAYIHIADSLDDWLERLVDTGGWDGMGGKFVPL